MPTKSDVDLFCRHLEPGGLYIGGQEPVMVSAVLGSGLAVCFYDRRLKTGSMGHFLFPGVISPNLPEKLCAPAVIGNLTKAMKKNGSRPDDLEAMLVGGGERPGPGLDKNRIGPRNVEAARKLLKKHEVAIVSEDVGGMKGRRLIFYPGTNETMVMKTHRIRRGDYYPYRRRNDS